MNWSIDDGMNFKGKTDNSNLHIICVFFYEIVYKHKTKQQSYTILYTKYKVFFLVVLCTADKRMVILYTRDYNAFLPRICTDLPLAAHNHSVFSLTASKMSPMKQPIAYYPIFRKT